jgi:prevent-host-death family protein
MIACTARTARTNFKRLLDQASRGQRVAITRRGKTIAHIEGATTVAARPFPDLSAFRATIHVKGQPLSGTVRHNRDEERY